MPRFFFNTADGGRDEDKNGVELPSLAAARNEATRYAGSVLGDQPDILSNGRFCVEVTDADGELLFEIVTSMVDGTVNGSDGTS